MFVIIFKIFMLPNVIAKVTFHTVGQIYVFENYFVIINELPTKPFKAVVFGLKSATNHLLRLD